MGILKSEVELCKNLSKSSRPADPVQICLTVGFAIDIHWQVKVHYNGHLAATDKYTESYHSNNLEKPARCQYPGRGHWL